MEAENWSDVATSQGPPRTACLQPPEAERGRKEPGPAHTCQTSGLQNGWGVGENLFLWYEAPHFVVLCYGSPGEPHMELGEDGLASLPAAPRRTGPTPASHCTCEGPQTRSRASRTEPRSLWHLWQRLPPPRGPSCSWCFTAPRPGFLVIRQRGPL